MAGQRLSTCLTAGRATAGGAEVMTYALIVDAKDEQEPPRFCQHRIHPQRTALFGYPLTVRDATAKRLSTR